MAMLPPPPLERPTEKEKKLEKIVSSNMKKGIEIEKQRKSMPKQPLVAPSKNAIWNSQISSNVASRIINDDLTSVIESARQNTSAVMKQAQTELNRIEAKNWESLKGGFLAGEQNNDFVAMRDYVKEQDISSNVNQEWVDTVSSVDNATALANSYGIPSSYISQISETKNQDHFFYFVNRYRLDKEKNEYINNKASTLAQIAGNVVVGGGFDTLAGLILPVGFIGKAKKIMSSIDSAMDAEKALSRVNSIKKTATVAGLSYSVTMPFVKNQIHENYTFVDGLIDAVAFGAIDTGLIVNRGLSSIGREIDTMRHNYVYREAIDNLPSQNQIAYNQPKLLEYKPKTETVSSKIDEINKYDEATISSRVDYLSKTKLSLEKRISNTRIGKQTKQKAIDDLAKIDDELSALKTASVSIKKTKNLAKKEKLIQSTLDRFGLNASKESIKNTARVFDDAIDEISSVEGLEDIGKKIAKDNGGKSFSVKADKEGNIDVGVKLKDGTFKSLTGKQKAGIIASLGVLSTGTAMADDGDGNIISDIPQYAAGAFLLYMAGSKALEAVYANKGVINAIKATSDKVKARTTHNELKNDKHYSRADKLYDSFNKTKEALGFHFATAIANSDSAGAKLARDLFWDVDNTFQSTSEILKATAHQNNMEKFYSSYNKAWDEYIKEIRINEKGLVAKLGGMSKHKSDFNEAVTFALENPTLKHNPIVQNLANSIRQLYDDIINRASASGMKGFRTTDELGEVVNKADNYVTRILQTDNVFRFIKNIDGDFKEGGYAYSKIEENLRKMYSSANPDKTSDEVKAWSKEYMDGIKTGYNSQIQGDVGAILGDTASRAKHRISLDTTKWEDFDIEVNGVQKTFRIDEVYERDIEKLFYGYSNSMEGHIALAKKNYKSFTKAYEIAGSQANKDARRSLVTGLNMLLGRKSFDTDSELYQATKGVTNLSSPLFMSLSAIMQLKEAGSTMIRSMKNYESFKLSLNELVNVLKARGSDDYLVDFSIQLSGTGNRMMTNKLHSRVFNDVEAITDDMSLSLAHKFNKASTKARDLAMVVYGIAPLTDWGQRMNGALNLNTLAKWANGEIKMTRTEMEAFGLTDDMIDKFKSHLSLNEKGNLSKSSVDKLKENENMYEEIQRVVFNMNQQQMLQPTLGATPMMFHDSALGSVLSNLMTFAMNAYSVYGGTAVKGMARGEPSAYFDTVLWIGTMYAAEAIKNGIKDKDIDEEEMLVKAMMNTPIMAPFSWAGALRDPLAANTVEELTAAHYISTQSMVDIISDGI